MRSKKLSEIAGYENASGYTLFEDGAVYIERAGKFARLCTDSKGYKYLDLRGKNCVCKCPKVHRLVMLAFKPDGKLPQINHIDGDKGNNHVNNLEWCTNSQNREHAIRNGLKVEISGKVDQYSTDGKFIQTFDSCDKACVAMCGRKRSGGSIGRCIRGKRKTAFGFIWKLNEGSTTIPEGSTLQAIGSGNGEPLIIG